MLFAGKNNYLYASIALALIIHGGVLFFTFEQTYDAYVHMFFASHYAANWFETWNPQWYTGFTITSYPPLVHQIVALLSFAVGLKLAFILWSLFVIALFVRGVYFFSALFVPHKAMKYVALVAPFSFSFTEALHIFGQLPSLTGVSLLLNACPFIYKWFRQKMPRDFFTALAMLALTTCAHHVTTIFGMVFFVLPVIGLALLDNTAERHGLKTMTFFQFLKTVQQEFVPAITFGMGVIFLTLVVILPYWLWSKSDPITQISIPHGSRENFIANGNLGIVFFLIPWGMMLFALPYIFHKFFTRRLIFFGLSFSLLFVLGTGGTTPIPRMMLGDNAFEILTLDRFTFWATVMALPFWGLLFYDLFEGRLFKDWTKNSFQWVPRSMALFLVAGTLLCTGIIMNLSNLKPLQPDKIDMQPIVNFLQRDNHDKWRYLTLGFGDQMAWLSANTDAQTVDGNYHSVRRLPELTSRAVERLENAKYLGMEGLGALRQFLTVPEHFYLKYIFSNDKFYEPILYFTGWKRLGPLENDVVLWEKPDVPFMPELLPSKDIPKYQKWIWGVFPLMSLGIVAFIYLFFFKINGIPFYCPQEKMIPGPSLSYPNIPRITTGWMAVLFVFVLSSMTWHAYDNHDLASPENTVMTYFNAIDFKDFTRAYELFVPGAYPDIEQYVLELSLSDGILASYAKLDSLEVNISSVHTTKALAMVKATWITSLQSYTSSHTLELSKRGPQWYIEPFEKDLTVPPEVFIRQPQMDFKSHGRRSIRVQSNEDILDRPVAILEEARLVRSASGYHIIGYVRNVDVDPAHITLEGTLFDIKGREMGRFGMADIGVHALQPLETAPFRIDFIDEGWGQSSLLADNQHEKAQPVPSGFAVFASTVITDEDLYRNFGAIKTQCAGDDAIKGEIINYGTKEITIPQILYAIVVDGELTWVSANYRERGIRSQRTQEFHLALDDVESIEIIKTAQPEEMIINGMNMTELAQYDRFPDAFADLPIMCGDRTVYLKINAFVNEINR